MPNLSIKHTIHPCGFKEAYLHGMPKPEPKPMGAIMKLAVFNEVRAGGIAYRDLDHVEQVKRQLNIK